MVHPVRLGKKIRMSYSKVEEILDIPYLIEIQKKSYKWFLEEGLKEVFKDISPITDYTGNLILEFIDYTLEDNPKYCVEECKERDCTFSAPLKVKVRLINKETGEVKEQEIFMGDFPLMTVNGTFISPSPSTFIPSFIFFTTPLSIRVFASITSSFLKIDNFSTFIIL